MSTPIDRIKNALQESHSYADYRTLQSDLVSKGLSTGPEQSEALSHYSMMNERRFDRLDKKGQVSEEKAEEIKKLKTNQTWVVLTESWCGDAAQSLPFINKLAELNDGIDLKILLRDTNEEVMNDFLTNGGKSIPKLIMIDNESDTVIGDWGPRPSEATKMVNDFKNQHGSLSAEFKKDLQLWYNKDKGEGIVNDIIDMVSKF